MEARFVPVGCDRWRIGPCRARTSIWSGRASRPSDEATSSGRSPPTTTRSSGAPRTTSPISTRTSGSRRCAGFVAYLADPWSDRFGPAIEWDDFIDCGDWVVAPWSGRAARPRQRDRDRGLRDLCGARPRRPDHARGRIPDRRAGARGRRESRNGPGGRAGAVSEGGVTAYVCLWEEVSGGARAVARHRRGDQGGEAGEGEQRQRLELAEQAEQDRRTRAGRAPGRGRRPPGSTATGCRARRARCPPGRGRS